MNTQQQLNYERVAQAISYIRHHHKKQPALEELAAAVHLSPYHFQRLFSDWAGTSPKKFLQYISVNHAKQMLKEHQSSLLDAALETGLSGTSRLHDLFVGIEGMTPAEYKHGGRHLQINFSFADSLFGKLIVAATTKGICYMAFVDAEDTGFAQLQQQYPNAVFRQRLDRLQQNALSIFQQDWKKPNKIRLHLRGTAFQLKIWEALLKIPPATLTTYGALAKQVAAPGASRAVGTAIGANPVAYLIPCHRVIQSSGIIGGYRWGSNRKAAIIGWEAVQGASPEHEIPRV